MATGQASELLRQICREPLLRESAGLTDSQLLAGYLARRDATALAALVGRHAAMVWGVCRRVLGNDPDAEDAFQASFLVLVRKAASIASPELLANWLHGVAHMTALKARATGGKRRSRERQVTDMPEPAVTDQQLWDDMQAVLDQELGRLGDKYRIAILLCDLEGKTRKEAARQLGVPEGTLAARLTRGRQMLAKRLARRGIAVPGAALGALLAQQAAAQVPASVLSSAIKAAGVYAAGPAATAGLISVNVAALTQGVLKTMLLQNLKMASVLVLVFVCLAAGTATLLVRGQASSAEPGKKEVAKSDGIQGTWRLTKMEVNGVEVPFFLRGSHAVIVGDHLSTNFMEEKEFTITLRSDAAPKQIDLQPLAEPKQALVGIYHRKGDELTLCIRTSGKGRPATLDAYWGAGTHTARIVLERQPDEANGSPPKERASAAAPRNDEELLQGIWLAVAMETDGEAAPVDEVNKNKLTLVFKGDRITSYDLNGRRGTGDYKLDPTKDPKWLDVVFIARDSKDEVTERTIYKVEGDTLTLAEGRDNERPPGFTTDKEGPTRRVILLKRQASAELPKDGPGPKPPRAKTPRAKTPSVADPGATPTVPSLSVQSAHQHRFGKAGESHVWTLAGQGAKELTAYLVVYTDGKAERVSEVHCVWGGPSPPLSAQIAFLDQAGQPLGAERKRHLSLSVTFGAGAPDKKTERLTGKLIDEPRGGRSSMKYDPVGLAFENRIVLHNDHLHMKPERPLQTGEIRSELVGGGTSDAEMARASREGRLVVAVVLEWKK